MSIAEEFCNETRIQIPAMPGCFTAADTLDECRANIVEAAHGWLEARLSWLMGRPAQTGDRVPA